MKEDSTNPYLRQTEDGKILITKKGFNELARIVTDIEAQVYAFNGTIPSHIVAAAMARLSRRSGDMRLTYLDEFAEAGVAGADALIERVVTQYGDDSVQQLVNLQIVVEGASNLLTKLLEWGRFGSYLEQSTRYIYFDQKDKNGDYLYFMPSLPREVSNRYVETMDAIFDKYSKMVHELTEHLRKKHPEPKDKKERMAWISSTRATACDAIRPVLPVATKSTVGINGSAQMIENLIIHLLSESTQEAQEVGHKILEQARKVIPAFLRRADLPERGGAMSAYRAQTRTNLRNLTSAKLGNTKSSKSDEKVELLDYWPRHEKKLAAELLYEASNLSMSQIERKIATWNDQEIENIFKTYFGERLNRRHRPGRALEKAHFEWEVVADYGTFRDLQRHRVVDAWEWQRLSPDLGYKVPELVVEAGFEKQYRQCFELAENLYEYLVQNNLEVEAQYATLLGHQMRYRFIFNARALFHFLELRTTPAGHPGYRKICNQMYDRFAEVYPLTAGAMKFINRDEDPELTRQAAELATQFKLEKLGMGGEFKI